MAEELTVEVRQTQGKRNARRMRAAGKIPAVLYGHGKKCVDLCIPHEGLNRVIRHGSRVVMLSGAVNERAQIKELQWNTWGNEVLHVDLTRVSAHEKIEVTLPVELRGEAPGIKEGGVVEQLLHEINLACPADSVPESISVSVNRLGLGGSVSIADLELPKGAACLDDASSVIVHCVEPVAVPEEEGVEAAAEGEPEVIGQKEEETSEGE